MSSSGISSRWPGTATLRGELPHELLLTKTTDVELHDELFLRTADVELHDELFLAKTADR